MMANYWMMSVLKCLSILVTLAILADLKNVSEVSKSNQKDRRIFGWSCKSGWLYRENNCKWCLCILGIFSKCIGLSCVTDEYYSLRNCKIGTYWKVNCNDCICVEERGTVCTTYDCSSIKPMCPDADPACSNWNQYSGRTYVH